MSQLWVAMTTAAANNITDHLRQSAVLIDSPSASSLTTCSAVCV